MKSCCVFSILADILRGGESLTLDLFNSVLVIDRSFTSMKSRYVFSYLADILRAGKTWQIQSQTRDLNWQAF